MMKRKISLDEKANRACMRIGRNRVGLHVEPPPISGICLDSYRLGYLQRDREARKEEWERERSSY